MIASLARADNTIYDDLVTNLNARSYGGADQISTAEIRTLATNAYSAALRRKGLQARSCTASVNRESTSSKNNKQKPKGDSSNKKDPWCKICEALGKNERHWHKFCPNLSNNKKAVNTKNSTEKKNDVKKNVTFEEVEDDE